MKRCQCKTLKGTQCTLNASTKSGDNPDFCDTFHQKCTPSLQIFSKSPKIIKNNLKSPGKRNKCQCLTTKGKRCKLNASTKPGNNHLFCDRFHQKNAKKSHKIVRKRSKKFNNNAENVLLNRYFIEDNLKEESDRLSKLPKNVLSEITLNFSVEEIFSLCRANKALNKKICTDKDGIIWKTRARKLLGINKDDIVKWFPYLKKLTFGLDFNQNIDAFMNNLPNLVVTRK